MASFKSHLINWGESESYIIQNKNTFIKNIYIFATENTPACGRIFEAADNVIVHIFKKIDPIF